MGHWTNYGMDWWMWALMTFGTVGLWALVVLVVRDVFQGRPTQTQLPPRSSSDPLRLLDDRLARGEITSEEYERARSLLAGAH